MSRKKNTRPLWIQTAINTTNYDEMPVYAKQIWSTVPHYIASKEPDENGDYWVLYPSSFDCYTCGGDVEGLESVGGEYSYMAAAVYNNGEDDTAIRATLVMMKTKDVAKAEKAILSTHSLFFAFNQWYTTPVWLKMLDTYYASGYSIDYFKTTDKYWRDNDAYIPIESVLEANRKEGKII
jgi:hypothetical protein